MPNSQQWYVFGNAVLYSFIHKSAAVRFFEYAANSAGGERLHWEGETLLAGQNRWHYSTEWKLRFIQNVASSYVFCLTKESVNTATLVHAPVCVCVCVCVPRTPHGGLSDTSALEISSGGGSGLNSLPVRSPEFEKPRTKGLIYNNQSCIIHSELIKMLLMTQFPS